MQLKAFLHVNESAVHSITKIREAPALNFPKTTKNQTFSESDAF